MELKIQDKNREYPSPIVMGIINCTPDSFYSASRKQHEKELITAVETQIEQGADIIDIGGFSTRPGIKFITEGEELERVQLPIKWLTNAFPDQLFSIDTFRAHIANWALDNGVHIINDISAGTFDPKITEVVARYHCPYIIMHLIGNLKTMHQSVSKGDIVTEVLAYFKNKIQVLQQLGIQQLIIDPGFGFSKTMDDNFKLLKHLPELGSLDLPLLVGLSRKTMIWKTLGITPEDALNGTSVLNTIALMNGASILRVHDVKAAVEAINLFQFTMGETTLHSK